LSQELVRAEKTKKKQINEATKIRSEEKLKIKKSLKKIENNEKLAVSKAKKEDIKKKPLNDK
jgi:hypothetical protein